MRTLFRRVRYMLDSRRRDAELSEELECHRRMVQERLERSGMPTSDAELIFGNARRIEGRTGSPN